MSHVQLRGVMHDQEHVATLPLTTLHDAAQRFRCGWHLDIHVRGHEAYWISPSGDRLEIPLDDAWGLIESLGRHLEAMYAPGHAYYVIAEPTAYTAA